MKNILLIEDDQIINDNLSLLLSLSGYNVLSCNNGQSGVEIALRENPNLILCGTQIPILDGYAVINILGNNPKTSDIPFIFINGPSEPETQRKGMNLGADDFLIRPINNTDLLDSISRRLAKSESLKQKTLINLNQENGFAKNERPLLANHKTATHLVTDEHEKQHLKKKHTLYSIGQRTSFLYYVEKGKIKEFLISEEGKELITGIYSEGDYFGYTEILLETNYKRSSKVIEDATLCLIHKQEFLQKVNTHPATAQFFIKLLSNQVVENGEILINMAYHSLRKKVASAIIRITDKFKDTFDNKKFIDICRDDLASIVGAPQESVIRTLKEFKSEKLIDVIDNGRIVILDEQKLKIQLLSVLIFLNISAYL